MEVKIYSISERLAVNLAEDLVRLSEECINKRGVFSVALSGGSLPTLLRKVAEAGARYCSGDGDGDRIGARFSQWRIAFVDERVVPLTHPDSNYFACKDFFESIGAKPENILPISEFEDERLAASQYETSLREFLEQDVFVFDVVLLGMGPDGHTASLFPNHPLLSHSSQAQVLSISDSPKSPPRRITLSLQTINRASHVWFVVTGASKAPVIAQILLKIVLPCECEGGSPYTVNQECGLPAALVRPESALLRWYLDADAASPLL